MSNGHPGPKHSRLVAQRTTNILRLPFVGTGSDTDSMVNPGEDRYVVLVDRLCCEGVILSKGQLLEPSALKCVIHKLVRVGAVRRERQLAGRILGMGVTDGR